MIKLPSDLRPIQQLLPAALCTATIAALFPLTQPQPAHAEPPSVHPNEQMTASSDGSGQPVTLPKLIGAAIVERHQTVRQKSQSELSSKQAFLKKSSTVLHNVEALKVSGSSATQVASAAEDAESLRQQLLIEPLVELRVPGFAPGSTAGGPSAFGADFGDAYVGISGSNRRAREREADGSISAGFGLGNANKAVGLEVNVNIGSLRRFAANGDVGFKVHRNVAKDAAIAIGWDSGVRWGDENKDTPSTVYGVTTKIFELKPEDTTNKMPLTVSVGLGSGRFQSFDDAKANRNSVGLFGSLGLQVAPQASLVSTWTGRDLNLGVSLVPIRTQPFFVTAVAANVLGRDDASTVYTLSLGYGFNYAKLFGSR
jgi:hypothetical protein